MNPNIQAIVKEIYPTGIDGEYVFEQRITLELLNGKLIAVEDNDMYCEKNYDHHKVNCYIVDFTPLVEKIKSEKYGFEVKKNHNPHFLDCHDFIINGKIVSIELNESSRPIASILDVAVGYIEIDLDRASEHFQVGDFVRVHDGWLRLEGIALSENV